MKLIIDVKDEIWDWLVNGFPDEEDAVRLLDIVKNGTPLSESEDCISRQAVLDEIDKRFDLAKSFKQLIKSMPSVTPTEKVGKWIPVSERLPEPCTFVNVTCHSLIDDREDWVVETLYLPIPKNHNPMHYSDWGNIPMLNDGDCEVIAWVERIIPEPYKVEPQESEDKE